MPTDTKLNQLIINQLTQEQYDEAKAAGTLSDTELYITDSDDEVLTNNKISNCITEIPQDIKLELNNGTLTLKAGSKVYIPNGPDVFDEVIVSADKILTALWGTPNENMLLYYHNNTLMRMPINRSLSGSSDTYTEMAHFWYDTTNNIMKEINAKGEVVRENYSLPLCIFTAKGDNTASVISIDQVFNGFGYIGSTVFALPGVKGLIPNGRNEDGSLKNIEFTLDSVKTSTIPVGVTYTSINMGITTETVIDLNFFTYYEKENIIKNLQQSLVLEVNCATLDLNNGKITSFTPKTPFHALDYNDKSTISGWSMPSSRYIDLTLGASGSTYTAPANGWIHLVTDINANGFLSIDDNYFQGCGTNSFVGGKVSIRKGQTFYINYNGYIRTILFRFIYAEGEPYNPVSSSSDGGLGSAEVGGQTGPEINPWDD